MEQFIQFVSNHWLLWTAFSIVLLLVILEEARDKLTGIPRLSPQEVIQLLNREQGVVVDIRDTATYKSGHIVGALSAPRDNWEAQASKLEKLKDKTLILVCATGQESAKIAHPLPKQGFKVAVLAGGLNAWRNAGLPLVKE